MSEEAIQAQAEEPRERPIYERLPEETPKAFAAFQHYRDTPPEQRSILNTYRHVQRKPSAERASGSYSQWSIRYRWTERAEAWDTAVDRTRLQKSEEDQIARYEQFREEVEGFAREARTSATNLLILANRKLQKLVDDPEADVPVEHLPRIFRAAAAVGEAGLNAEAMALGVSQLVADLDRD